MDSIRVTPGDQVAIDLAGGYFQLEIREPREVRSLRYAAYEVALSDCEVYVAEHDGRRMIHIKPPIAPRMTSPYATWSIVG
jgi:hypothetical protein